MSTREIGIRLGLVSLAAAAAVLRVPAPAVERVYSTRAYLAIQPLLTSLSNRTAFALLDALILAVLLVVVCGAVAIVCGARGSRVRASLQAGVRAVTWAAVLYLAFLLLWGLNYRRLRLIDKLEFERSAVTSDAAHGFAIRAATELKTLHEPAHRAGWSASGDPEPSLAVSFAATIRQLGVQRPVTVARPKRTLLDRYFRSAGVDGMTDPFFLETLVASDLLPFERPFVVAHEWSHLAGFAAEGDANFVGWLTCLHGSVGDQYSGWLFLYSEVAGGMAGPERVEIASRLAAGPRADLAAIRARLRRAVNPRVAAAGWRVYDQYLKANRVEAGAKSYGHVVRLVLGVRFGPGWVPLRDDVR